MIRLNYHFKTKGPLHTGSDINAGTLRTLRRQKCILADPVSYASRLDDEQRREAVVHIAMGVYRSLDFNMIKGTRLMGIWDEFTNKLIAAGRTANKYQFLEVICRSWGINSMTKDYVLRALDALSDYELLDTVRNESIYIVLKLRALKDALKEEGVHLKNKADIIESFMAGGEYRNVVRSEDAVPCISGNSIRGKFRRLVMSDFCKQAGITKLDKRVYHTLFSGGFLDQSTQFEDFGIYEKTNRQFLFCRKSKVTAG